MEIPRVRFDKDALLNLPEEQRRLFVALAHQLNEISLLLRALAWSYQAPENNEAKAHGQLATWLFFLRLLAGKLREGWELLSKHYFPKKALADLFNESASPEQAEALKALKQYFGKTNRLHKIRNNFAFHYSPESIEAALHWAPDELYAYLGEGNGANSLFYFAEAIANHALLETDKLSNPIATLEEYKEEVPEIASHFMKFGWGFMLAVMQSVEGGLLLEEPVKVDLGEIPKFSEVRFPWFVDPR